jgi:DNA polymerase-4
MTQILAKLAFNQKPSYFMHIDLNSCFATAEQQANPLLRNRPVGVAAYDSPRGVIIAPSVEAKKLGIKVGFRVAEAKKICPEIVILPPDADKYRYIHHALKKILKDYTDKVSPQSIDEFVLDFKKSPYHKKGLLKIGGEIKKRIKKEVGDYLTVSIGISKNKFLAKTASNLRKPDGLDEIDENNYREIYRSLELIDLCGIGRKLTARLNTHGVHSVWQFYQAPPYKLKNIFRSIAGYYWYLKLRGYEVEDYRSPRRTFGQQYALPLPAKNLKELTPILIKLVEKMGQRLRNEGYKTGGVHLGLLFSDNTYWHMGRKTGKIIYDSKDIYREMLKLYFKSPRKPIKTISVSCFNLRHSNFMQLELFDNSRKKENLTKTLDKINNRWGKFVIGSGSLIGSEKYVPDRIGFGNVSQ